MICLAVVLSCRCRLLVPSMIIGVSFVTNAYAIDEVGYGLELGAGHSDNIKRTPAAELDESVGTATIDLAVKNETRRLKVSAAGVGAYLKYLGGAYDPDFIGSFDGALTANLIPDRFVWMAKDNFAQGARDQFAVDTPDNRENINYFTTGPTFSLLFGDRTSAHLSGYYSKVSFSTNRLDQDRYGGELRLVRDISKNSSLSLNGTNEHVTFHSGDAADDYRKAEYYVRYQLNTQRTSAAFDLGYARLFYSTGTESAYSGRFEVARQISSTAAVRLQLGREYSDAGNSIRQLQDAWGTALQTVPVQVSGSPYFNNFATLGLDFRFNRTTMYTGISRYKESYKVTTDLDRALWIGNLELRRRFTQAFSMYLLGDYIRQEFSVLSARDYNDSHAGIGIDYKIGMRTLLNLQIDHFGRSENAAATGFHENQIWLTVSYGVGERPHRSGRVRSEGFL